MPSLLSLVFASSLCACAPKNTRVVAPVVPRFSSSKVRSFTDSFSATAIADTASGLWVGTPRGLLRWDVQEGKVRLVTSRDGLASDRVIAVAPDHAGGVWVATSQGVSHFVDGKWTTVAPAPVGEFLAGLVSTADGKRLWAGGPQGLARYDGKAWVRYLSDTAITAIALGSDGAVWAGTGGQGVFRVTPGSERIEQFGPRQGCELDVVRGVATSARGVFFVGDSADGAHAAFYNGERFFSYRVEVGHTLEWVVAAGGELAVGGGASAYNVVFAGPQDPAPQSAQRLVALDPIWVVPPRPVALWPELPSSALADLSREKPGRPAAKRELEKLPRGPRLDLRAIETRLPDGVSAVASSDRGIVVGTRFQGVTRIENGVPRVFRSGDLTAGATRLSVACTNASGEECYLATGAERAWRFDGQAFQFAQIDPEQGSHVLAVLSDGKDNVVAIHRGASDSALRISRVDDGRWSPIAIQAVKVPVGVPALNFATFSPDGHLWVGLQYIDHDRDPIDFGAAEIVLETGRVGYHRQGNAPAAARVEKKASRRRASAKGIVSTEPLPSLSLPNDVVAMFWRAPNEAWFGTRSGAAQLLDGKLRIYTENDGMDSEIVRDILGTSEGQVWVATKRGTGRYDGTRWTFTRMGAFSHKTSALGRDSSGNMFLGTDKGVFCVGKCDGAAIDAARGMLDDAVIDLSIDSTGRVWVLTPHGLSIVEP